MSSASSASFDPQKVLAWKFPEVEHTYTEKDTILYALGLGCGSDPEAPADLRFVYEKGLIALPTMAVVLAHPGNWLASSESTVDYSKVLHGEQSLTLHRPLPPAGTVIGRTRIVALLDKGPEKGSVLYSERSILDKASGAPIATMASTTMLRGNGGWGGKPGPQPAPHRLPETAPTAAVDLETHANSALIYRLSGDRNPLHADPAAAAAGGFTTPILHGLLTFGVAGRALIEGCCGGDPARLRSMQVRFSAPAFPGETIRTELWEGPPSPRSRGEGQGNPTREGQPHPPTPDGARQVSFRCRAVERDAVVLNNGLATVA
jgi:acyl dehydratase